MKYAIVLLMIISTTFGQEMNSKEYEEIRKKIKEIEKSLDLSLDEKSYSKTHPVNIRHHDLAQIKKEKTLGYKLKKHPQNVKSYKGHYYLLVKFKSWQDAFDKAKELGGYLAVSTSKKELEFIHKLTATQDSYVIEWDK